MKVSGKIVGKTKIDRIRSQQIGEYSVIQPINEWVERKRRECDEHVTRIDAETIVKVSSIFHKSLDLLISSIPNNYFSHIP